MSEALITKSTVSTETSGDVPWDAVSDRLRRFISKRVDQASDVEDILQDTFVKIHVNLPRLKDRDKLTAWTYQIARNTIADFYRRQRDDADLTDDDELVHETTSAEASREIVSCLRPMVDGLDGYYREAILLTEYDGLNQREMAERLGISVSGQSPGCNAPGPSSRR